jgi:hypothetical protein
VIETLTRGAQPTLTAVRRRHHLRRLVSAPLAMQRRLHGVGGDGLIDDRARELLVCIVRSRLAMALTLVPSIAITPTVARPASAHSASTSPKRSPSVRS